MVQVVEYLPGKHKTLTSNLKTDRNKEQKTWINHAII
jgi:hypothetical protein